MHASSVSNIMHIALQGCLKPGSIDYGITADTGGHIRYLLELVRQLERAGIEQTIVTRRFCSPALGACYALPNQQLSERVRIYRVTGQTSRYLTKEQLYTDRTTMIDSFCAWFDRLEQRPDLIHAHYADAGIFAATIKSEFGTPFLFTPHSLGAVKADMLMRQGSRSAALSRRIADEQAVIDAADAVLVSSRDEASRQLGLYHLCGTRVITNPPGCDLARFRPARPDDDPGEVQALIEPLLSVPGKPLLLALARPVWRKNLHGLLEAYAASPRLQRQANLVIFAGCHDGRIKLDDEAHAVLAHLFERVRECGLEGKVALPTFHESAQVPAIFRYASQQRGLFVNIASNEPFGLTLLEAAATGLPVIATSQGGCPDTLQRCENGESINPHDLAGFADTALRMLGDTTCWQHYATNGVRKVRHFSWQRHVEQYLQDIRSLPSSTPAHRDVRRLDSAPLKSCYLVADMDGTLLGGTQRELDALGNWLIQHADVGFIVATGRRAQVALRMLKQVGCLLPEAIIGSVGSQIMTLKAGQLDKLDGRWIEQGMSRWNRHACAEALATVPAMVYQPDSEQNALKLSYRARDGRRVAPLIRERLAMQALQATVILSHGELIDIVPPDGGKAAAATYYCQQRGLQPQSLIAAGDSGNDADMLERFGKGIVVGNHTGELEHLRNRTSVHFVVGHAAGGVLEGLRLFAGTFDGPAIGLIDSTTTVGHPPVAMAV